MFCNQKLKNFICENAFIIHFIHITLNEVLFRIRVFFFDLFFEVPKQLVDEKETA